MFFRYFIIISPWKRAEPFILRNLYHLHPRMLCVKFGWNWTSGFAEEFYNSSMYFRYFVIFSPWKMVWSFIWTNLIPLDPRMLCAKFGWSWPGGSWEEDANVKSLLQRRTKDHLSLRFRWAKRSSDLNCIEIKRGKMSTFERKTSSTSVKHAWYAEKDLWVFLDRIFILFFLAKLLFTFFI